MKKKNNRKEIILMNNFSIDIEETKAVCPIGEQYGKQCQKDHTIPVLSCEGSCIRGEIARLAANLIAKETPYRRGCHGEIFTAPHSAISQWATNAEKVVIIDGCFMQCHGRILKKIIPDDRLLQFDALAIHRKYSSIMDSDDVPEEEQKQTALLVAKTILNRLKHGTISTCASDASTCCRETACT
jgi:uncharacterized metal-binding protein